MEQEKKRIIITFAVLAVIVVGLYFTASFITKYTGYSITGNVISESSLEEFAKCLTEKGAIMYGSATCSHCANQKALFKNAFKYINYTECLSNPEQCVGLEGVPAWKINEKIIIGEQKLENLAELSGCKLNK
ncbi:hypothetical protein FJZ19_04585 [Candidatus Pacearchaeota archaeon]|nr:hypothetical protein [Candidatus Pacearchaeota archaeon]